MWASSVSQPLQPQAADVTQHDHAEGLSDLTLHVHKQTARIKQALDIMLCHLSIELGMFDHGGAPSLAVEVQNGTPDLMDSAVGPHCAEHNTPASCPMPADTLGSTQTLQRPRVRLP